MSWWNRLLRTSPGEETGEQASQPKYQPGLPGWVEQDCPAPMTAWTSPKGGALTLASMQKLSVFHYLDDEEAVRDWARGMAADQSGGLIEAHTKPNQIVAGVRVPALALIIKRLKKPAYRFTGMLLLDRGQQCDVWTVVAREGYRTGVREATIAAELFASGDLTVESYESRWGGDPYDPSYKGVDGNVMRFISDDAKYDERFPSHPLTVVRRTLRDLPAAITIEQANGNAG